MKKNAILSMIGILALAAILLTGCAASAVQPESGVITEVTEAVPQAEQTAAVTAALLPEAQSAPVQPAGLLTAEEAQAIALKHAGLTAEQVTGLRTHYELDDGRPEYEVDFRAGNLEYDYEIHGETGEILSWDKDRED